MGEIFHIIIGPHNSEMSKDEEFQVFVLLFSLILIRECCCEKAQRLSWNSRLILSITLQNTIKASKLSNL